MRTRGADNLKPHLKKRQAGIATPAEKQQNNNLKLGNDSVRSLSHAALQQDDLAENISFHGTSG